MYYSAIDFMAFVIVI